MLHNKAQTKTATKYTYLVNDEQAFRVKYLYKLYEISMLQQKLINIAITKND